ncbi:PE-PGRS family protein [Streptomyces sp. NPDC002644]
MGSTGDMVGVDDMGDAGSPAATAERGDAEDPERDAVWDALFDGTRGEPPLDAWAEAFAFHPDAPPSLLLRVLEPRSTLFYRRFPPHVLEAVLVHPDPRMRQAAFDIQPLTREQRSGMILAEKDERTRRQLAMIAGEYRHELTEEACERLASDPSAGIRMEAVRLVGLPVRLALQLAEDPDPGVRAFARRTAWDHLGPAARQAVLDDPRPGIRRAALLLHHRDHPLTTAVLETEGLDREAVRNCLLADDLVDHVLRHPDASLRAALAENVRVGAEDAFRLRDDPDPAVRRCLSLRPDLTEEQRAAVEIDVGPEGRYFLPLWVFDLHDDPDAMRRLARSAHPLVRRAVARARRLPADVVERLARDEDRVVQLFLAESCDDAPAEMLLRVAEWWSGSLSFPGRPGNHPNFPREGLLRFADDPNPNLRRLALDDPAATPDVAERLLDDPDPDVRYRAATDPRLPAATAVRLLAHPDGRVRHAARHHPGLPADVLVGLLLDPDTAGCATDHPAVPERVLRRMLDLAVG